MLLLARTLIIATESNLGHTWMVRVSNMLSLPSSLILALAVAPQRVLAP